MILLLMFKITGNVFRIVPNSQLKHMEKIINVFLIVQPLIGLIPLAPTACVFLAVHTVRGELKAMDITKPGVVSPNALIHNMVLLSVLFLFVYLFVLILLEILALIYV